MKLKEAFVYDLFKQYSKEEISFSRFVELINEEYASQEREAVKQLGKYKALKEYIKACELQNQPYFIHLNYFDGEVDICSGIVQFNAERNKEAVSDLNALLKDWLEGNYYTKEEILKAGEIGEVSMIDVRHVVSLLDEARLTLSL